MQARSLMWITKAAYFTHTKPKRCEAQGRAFGKSRKSERDRTGGNPRRCVMTEDRSPLSGANPGGAGEGPDWGKDRDRGTPRGATPPTPPGIRVTYHGGSTGLSVDRDMKSGETQRVEVAVGQCLLDRRMS